MHKYSNKVNKVIVTGRVSFMIDIVKDILAGQHTWLTIPADTSDIYHNGKLLVESVDYLITKDRSKCRFLRSIMAMDKLCFITKKNALTGHKIAGKAKTIAFFETCNRCGTRKDLVVITIDGFTHRFCKPCVALEYGGPLNKKDRKKKKKAVVPVALSKKKRLVDI